MMKKIISASALAVLALSAVSCVLNNPIYKDTTMAEVINATSVKTDAGLTYNIVDQFCEGTLESGKRVLVVCNVMKKTSNIDFDVELVYFTEPLNKESVRASSIIQSLGDDPIFINNLWVAGGYLNMRFTVQELEDGATHYINLAWDDTAPADTLRFTLLHDDGIDGIHIPDEDDDSVSYGNAFATFPIEALVPAELSEMPVKVSWTWDKEYCVKDGLKITVAR